MNPAATTEAELLARMADIRGFDPVGRWPLAAGWWVLLALLVVTVTAGIALGARRRRNRGWQADARRRLALLDHRLEREPAGPVLAEFSSLLRRIVLALHAREDCAGLTGSAWTGWLDAHDPAGFRWSDHDALLARDAYAPVSTVTAPAVRQMTAAAKAWLR